MDARVIQFSVLPEFVSETTLYFNEKINPVLKQQKGFISSQLLINYTTYQCLTITFWESEHALHASESNGFLSNTITSLEPFLAARPFIGYYKDAAMIGRNHSDAQ